FHRNDLRIKNKKAFGYLFECFLMFYQIFTRFSGEMYNLSPGLMSKALYQESTFCKGTYERYIPGACGSVLTWFLLASSRIFVLQMAPHEIKKRCSGVNPL